METTATFTGAESTRAKIFRGPLYHSQGPQTGVYHPDGGLVVNAHGLIDWCGPWTALKQPAPDVPLFELPPDHLLMPGFIDLHVHLPQLAETGRQADSLLKWLDEYIFKAESAFADRETATAMARWFFTELLKNGTTTAAVFLTSHPEATEIAFEMAHAMGNRVIMGQNLMDRNGPEDLLRPTQQLLAETEALAKRWHNADDGRIRYAWMPRFAVTCSNDLMRGLGVLRQKYPDIYLHTHLSEQTDEIAAVLELFPEAQNYTDAYGCFGLLGPRTILAHGIHLSDPELDTIHETHSCLAHCPGSNFFLKSGRFHLKEVMAKNLLWGLGSDVGAGPELSLFKAMKEAQYMQPQMLLSPHTLFYAATLGAARALLQDDRLGNFDPGKEADFIVVDYHGKSSLTPPDQASEAPADILSTLAKLIYLGDDRLIAATYVRGQQVYCQPGKRFEPKVRAVS